MGNSRSSASARSTERAEAFQPKVDLWQRLDTVAVEKVGFLLPSRIPCHMLTLIEGKKGAGKSSVLASIAVYVLGGPALPGTRKLKTPGRVLWLAGEESAGHAVRPRIEAAGGDPRGVVLPSIDESRGIRRRICLPRDLSALDELVRDQGVNLIIGDPYISFVADPSSMRDEDGARAVLEPLAEWAAARHVTIVYSRHLRKGRGGDAIDAGLGSTAVGNVARAVLRCDPHPLQAGLRTLSVVRTSFAKEGGTLTYQLVGEPGQLPHVVWEGECDLDADDLAAGIDDAGELDAKADAVMILTGILQDGPKPCKQVIAEALESGVSLGTLRRAKREMRVRSERIVTGTSAYSQWILPLCPVEQEKPQKRRKKG